MTSTTPITTGTMPAASPHSIAAPALGPERPVAWPKRTVRTLSNGMQVVLAESRTFPENFRAALFPQRQRRLSRTERPASRK